MLKKLLTGCLTIAMATAMATSAMAADVTVGGRATSNLVSTTYTPNEGDGYSYMNIESEGRIHAVAKASEGDWTFSGKVEVRSSGGAEAYSEPVILQKYFQLENDAFAIAMGTKWFGLAYLTPFMGLSNELDRECYGCANLRDDRISFKLKEVGLEIIYSADQEEGANSTGDEFVATELGLAYTGKFGPVTLAVQYLSISNAMVENFDQTTEDTTAKNGTSTTELTLGVQYAITEGMFVEFDYDSLAVVAAEDADPATTVMMGLAFSMAFSEAQGFTFAYDMKTADKGTDASEDDSTDVSMVLYFEQKIGGGRLFAGYEGYSQSVDGENVYGKTTIALGGRMDF